MSCDDTFLRMPQAVGLGDRDDLGHLVDIEIAAGAVVGAQQRCDSGEPAAEDLVLARVGRIEVDAGLGAADRRS